jgi:hypothetical protein
MVPPSEARGLSLPFQQNSNVRRGPDAWAASRMGRTLRAAMARPIRFEHYRWLGDKRSMLVHDLDAATEACSIDELMASEQFASFGPDLLAEARNRGYHACRHCDRRDAA